MRGAAADPLTLMRRPRAAACPSAALARLDGTVPLPHPRHYSVKTTAIFSKLTAELTEAVPVEAKVSQAMA